MMEAIAKTITIYISHAVEILAAVIIGIALIRALVTYLKVFGQGIEKKELVRVQFGSSVAVALELMLGADVLATAVAPSWDDIGKLAAIAIVRTALNYFLEKELQHLHRTASMEVEIKGKEHERVN
jgi:uncharacterized membrane protein